MARKAANFRHLGKLQAEHVKLPYKLHQWGDFERFAAQSERHYGKKSVFWWIRDKVFAGRMGTLYFGFWVVN